MNIVLLTTRVARAGVGTLAFALVACSAPSGAPTGESTGESTGETEQAAMKETRGNSCSASQISGGYEDVDGVCLLTCWNCPGEVGGGSGGTPGGCVTPTCDSPNDYGPPTPGSPRCGAYATYCSAPADRIQCLQGSNDILDHCWKNCESRYLDIGANRFTGMAFRNCTQECELEQSTRDDYCNQARCFTSTECCGDYAISCVRGLP